ncbi:hypothetical protein [Halostella sp. PRR32]|uniref:hypothetical protein n=1 Tax=Halostella sp. PRR32 TaxID=3098147 RepID=UPI00110D759D|nr:hypothetical protein [Halostella sp. PRR32]
MENQITRVGCGTVEPASRRTFGAAYWAALAGCLVSSALTYAYVGGAARELNPVLRAVIGTAGLEVMILVKIVAAVGGYWGYYLLGRVTGKVRVATTLGWVAAVVYVADALHDLRVAMAAGPAGLGEVGPGIALVLVATWAGVALRPPEII